MEGGDLVVVQIGGDEALRGELFLEDAHVVEADAAVFQVRAVRAKVLPHCRHRNWIAAEQLQVIGNIAMFLPFGLLWALTFEKEEKSAKTLLKTLLSSLCFSAFIEITQLIFSKGTFQFSDIVYNTLGGVLGAVIFIIINLIIEKKRS